jgi:hypothetical protein
MATESSKRRVIKIRRTGRHASPSQVERVAAQAGRAAPAMAIVGLLVAAPQAQHAFTALAGSATATVQDQGTGIVREVAFVQSVDPNSNSTSVATAPSANEGSTTGTTTQDPTGDDGYCAGADGHDIRMLIGSGDQISEEHGQVAITAIPAISIGELCGQQSDPQGTEPSTGNTGGTSVAPVGPSAPVFYISTQ